jgi:hypothetical protein
MVRSNPVSAQAAWPHRGAGAANPNAGLANVVYRSRAVRDMSADALHDLTIASQARNGREAITGVMFYDTGRFYQWLEGPVDSVGRVMGSISKDSRHTDIEILNKQSINARAFGAWTMKLATPDPNIISWRDDVIAPPRDVVEGLRARPQAAPVLLMRLGSATGSNLSPGPAAGAENTGKLNNKTAAILKTVILSSVLPALLREGDVAALAADLPKVAARAKDLAELLVAADDAAAVELMHELYGTDASVRQLYANLVEPAARSLGDLWNDDICSEFDLTLGLCRLQSAVRLLTSDSASAVPISPDQPAVLVVPEPGELHRLGAALDTSVLDNAGWAPHTEYPENDKALQDLLSSAWFDVLDLSLSVALRQEQWLPRLKQTIAEARRASQNPALVVVVAGRAFRELRDAGANVGADLASKTSSNVDRSILRTMTDTKTQSVSETLQLQSLATPS